MHERWSWSIGERGTRVRVYERADKGDVLHLYYFDKGKQRQESLRRKLRTNRGAIDRQTERWAREQCRAKHDYLAALAMGVSASALPAPTRGTYTVGDAIREVQDPDRGLYPHDTPHRREVLAALEYAQAIWGSSKTWNSLGRDDLRELGRRRVRELVKRGNRGLRGAEVTVTRFLTVATWLREEEKIHETACVPPRRWKLELKKFWQDEVKSRGKYEPERHHHKLHELPGIIDHSWHADPRFGLMMELGFALRAGQVRFAKRSDLDLEAGTLKIHGDGNKQGTVIRLNAIQRAAVEKALRGYLRDLEAASADYHLFPGGRLRKAVAFRDPGPCGRGTIAKWFRFAENLAGVDHVKGRSLYGLRRAATSGSRKMKISDEAMMIQGGWADSETPRTIYAEQRPDWALQEASDALARIRRGDVDRPEASETITPTITPATRGAGSGHDSPPKSLQETDREGFEPSSPL